MILFKVQQLTGMMRDNLSKLQARGEKFADLEVLSNELEKGSEMFQKSAGKLKKKKMWEKNKMNLIIGGSVALIVIILIIVVICSV